MWLTESEMAELTGYSRYADQRRWLGNHGWKFEMSASGRPIVAKAFANTQMGASLPAVKQWEPNLRVIR